MKDLSAAKWSHVTRRVPQPHRCRLVGFGKPPQLGDLIVAEVISTGGRDRLEDAHGRRVHLYPGDLVVGACGNRYATDAYEGYYQPGPRTHLLTTGGVIGTAVSSHTKAEAPTEIAVIGALAGEHGQPLSLEDFARPAPSSGSRVPISRVVAVVGSSMNSGKTTTAAAIVAGWTKAGLAAGAAKVTGSGSGKDRWTYLDAGARYVVDFLDFGMPSTFGYPADRLELAMTAMRDALAHDGADAIVLEIADGLLHTETRRLAAALPDVCGSTVLAVADALSASTGVALLAELGVRVAAVSGLVTASPLATRETMATTGLPVLSMDRLTGGGAVDLIAGPVGAT
ncbi:DUF1611 domain-containing protein [Amycolatopsis taiwanensis]|uniref:DUF1611 domain-containing protein n=1 Tax=Amycolatopsis taiwanensis TaxID=342230 RepID=A0A9W6R8M2_9PSEU|nr:DUF1611 domain-containing protein [Amycolatopsis taiwanensis]